MFESSKLSCYLENNLYLVLYVMFQKLKLDYLIIDMYLFILLDL